MVVAPFLPVFNALLPLAAGGLRMSYRRFLGCATIGAAAWAGLYLALGTASRSVAGLLPGDPSPLLVTMGVGLVLASVALLGARRRLFSVVAELARGAGAPGRLRGGARRARLRAVRLDPCAGHGGPPPPSWFRLVRGCRLRRRVLILVVPGRRWVFWLGWGGGYQPLAFHCGSAGRSAPRVESLPWPG